MLVSEQNTLWCLQPKERRKRTRKKTVSTGLGRKQGFTSRVPHVAHLFSSVLSFSSKQQNWTGKLSGAAAAIIFLGKADPVPWCSCKVTTAVPPFPTSVTTRDTYRQLVIQTCIAFFSSWLKRSSTKPKQNHLASELHYTLLKELLKEGSQGRLQNSCVGSLNSCVGSLPNYLIYSVIR
jgi:hypothetical protein